MLVSEKSQPHPSGPAHRFIRAGSPPISRSTAERAVSVLYTTRELALDAAQLGTVIAAGGIATVPALAAGHAPAHYARGAEAPRRLNHLYG